MNNLVEEVQRQKEINDCLNEILSESTKVNIVMSRDRLFWERLKEYNDLREVRNQPLPEQIDKANELWEEFQEIHLEVINKYRLLIDAWAKLLDYV